MLRWLFLLLFSSQWVDTLLYRNRFRKKKLSTKIKSDKKEISSTECRWQLLILREYLANDVTEWERSVHVFVCVWHARTVSWVVVPVRVHGKLCWKCSLTLALTIICHNSFTRRRRNNAIHLAVFSCSWPESHQNDNKQSKLRAIAQRNIYRCLKTLVALCVRTEISGFRQ